MADIKWLMGRSLNENEDVWNIWIRPEQNKRIQVTLGIVKELLAIGCIFDLDVAGPNSQNYIIGFNRVTMKVGTIETIKKFIDEIEKILGIETNFMIWTVSITTGMKQMVTRKARPPKTE